MSVEPSTAKALAQITAELKAGSALSTRVNTAIGMASTYPRAGERTLDRAEALLATLTRQLQDALDAYDKVAR